MKRIVAVLIMLSMLLSLSACKKRDEEGEDNDGNDSEKNGVIDLNNGDGDSDDPYVKYERDDLPEDLKYGGSEIIILCDSQQYGKSFADTYTGDVINSALFERIETVESRLDVKVNVVRQSGAYENMTSFAQKLEQSGEAYDLVLSYNLTPALMANSGLIRDLSTTKYLNFSKPWWSATLLDNIMINGKIYFTADNSSWNNIRNMLGVFVDKQLLVANYPDMKIDNLYDAVENDEWTMEKMFTLTTGTHREYDNVDGATEGDIYGLTVGNAVWIESFYYAAGFITLSSNEAGAWNFNIGSQKSIDFVDWFVSKYHGTEDIYLKDSEQYKMFKSGRSMFYVSALSMVEQQLETEFSVLPMPMYDVSQGGYKTHFSNTYDMYSIPTATLDPDRSSAVLECMASEAYRRIGPAYFDVYLKVRNASDSRLADMYDIIREGIVFDIGVLYGELFIAERNPVYYVRRALIQLNDSTGNWTSLSTTWNGEVNNQYLTLWQQNIDKLTS